MEGQGDRGGGERTCLEGLYGGGRLRQGAEGEEVRGRLQVTGWGVRPREGSFGLVLRVDEGRCGVIKREGAEARGELNMSWEMTPCEDLVWFSGSLFGVFRGSPGGFVSLHACLSAQLLEESSSTGDSKETSSVVTLSSSLWFIHLRSSEAWTTPQYVCFSGNLSFSGWLMTSSFSVQTGLSAEFMRVWSSIWEFTITVSLQTLAHFCPTGSVGLEWVSAKLCCSSVKECFITLSVSLCSSDTLWMCMDSVAASCSALWPGELAIVGVRLSGRGRGVAASAPVHRKSKRRQLLRVL